MTHLKDTELVDLLDGGLTRPRGEHLESCEDCRMRAQSLRDALGRVSEDLVPEPSPLFWEHFRGRVNAAIDQTHDGWFGGRLRTICYAAGSVLAVVLIVATIVWRTIVPAPPVPSGSAAGSSVRPSVTAARTERAVVLVDNRDVNDDEAWALVRAVADEVPWDDTRDVGINAHPGAADGAVMELNERERTELARLLQDALRRSGA